MMSHTSLMHAAAGHPAHGLETTPSASGVCATCGASICAGVPISAIETPTTSGHADLFRFGGQHVCDACAWLFGAGKGRPGNFVATPLRLEYTVISLESVVEDKRPWLTVLRELAEMPADTPVTGVMTTDVKPRLWHRCRLATIGRFGLYVHAPEYDVSEWRDFDLRACLAVIDLMLAPLRAGFAKASVYHGLLRDYARASRDLPQVMAWDAALAPHRQQSHFLPALIAAGVTKGEKTDGRTARPVVHAQPASAGSHPADQAQPGLFQ